MRWVPLGELPTEGEGFINFDEINTADPSVMAAAMRLILTGQLGEYQLPPGWRKFATGNRVEDGASANKMPTALADRFTHATLTVSVEDWVDWAAGNGVANEVIGFLMFQKHLLSSFDPQNTVNSTPRGWADVSKAVKQDSTLRGMATLAYAAGRVGQGPATEMRAFLDVWHELPDINKILSGEFKSFGEDPKPSVKYAVSMAVASQVSRENIGNALAFLDTVGPEFTKMAMLIAMKRDESLVSSSDYLKWATSGAQRLSAA